MFTRASRHPARRLWGAIAAVLVAASTIAFVVDPAQAATVVTTTYGYTGATQTFTVPAGVTSLTMTLAGGQGGLGGGDSQGSPTPGGYRGVVTGTLPVTPGQTITIAVGGGGGTGVSSSGSAAGGAGGQNPLTGYDGAPGGTAGPEGSSGGGGGSGAATVLRIGGVDIVAGGAGGNGGNGQFLPIVGRRAEENHTPRPDATSTDGRPGMNTIEACSAGYRCDGGASGAGGGGAQGGERGAVQYGGATATEYFGFGGAPGANSTGGFAGLSASYDYYAGNGAHGSIVISYDTGAPDAPTGLTGTPQPGAVALNWNAPDSSGSAPISDYVVQHATNPAGPYTLFSDGTSTSTSATVTGLTNGVTYYFRVAAVNDNGTGPFTATMTVGVMASDVPSAPNISAVSPFDSGLYVDFAPGATHSPITSYEYRLDGGAWLNGSVTGNRLTIAGLTNGRSYSVELRARNVVGPSSASAPQSGTPRAVALAPTDLRATAGDGTVALTWQAPASDNGSPVSDYVVEHATDAAGPYTVFADGTSNATSATVTGLVNGTTYRFRVAAVNGVGTGSPSASAAATPFTTPSTLTIAAVTPGDGTLTVSFTPGSNGGSAVSAYEYRVDGGAWQSTGSLATSFTVRGLTNGTTYDVTLRALNVAGPSPESAPASGTPRTVPAAPAISAVALDTGAVSVGFSVGNDGGSPITNVEYSLDGGSTWITRAPAGAASPLMISGLVGGHTYDIVLRAVNAQGPSAPSNVSSVTAKGTPEAPVIDAVSSGDRTLTVAFGAPANGGTPITNYEYSLDGGATWSTRTPASASSPIVINGLTNGTAYPVQIRAVNSVGTGAASATVVGTPRTVPGAPTIEGNTIVGMDGVLDVEFTAPTSDGGSPIFDYQYSTDGGATWRTRVTGSTSSPLRITTLSSDGTTPLTGGQVYPVEIRAVNAAGPGAASAVANGITTTAPAAPTITTVTTYDSSAAVAFTAPANGGSPISRYEYRLDGGAWTDTRTLASTFVIDGLVNSQAYTIELRAVNEVGEGPASAPRTIQVFATPGAPTITGVIAGDRSLSVQFDAGDDGGAAIVTYEYSTDGGVTWRTRATGTTGSPLTITTQSGPGAAPLDNATLYAVQIRAVNAAGGGAASESWLVAPRGAPSAPTGLVVTPGNGQLSLTFVMGADGGSPITAVEYQLDGGAWLDAGALSSPITIADLTNGQRYSVSIRTRNAIGASPATTPVQETPRTAPTAPRSVAVAGGPSSATVTWLAPISDGGAAITGYVATFHDQPAGGAIVSSCSTTGALTCTATGLTNGVALHVDVVATNAAGASVASAPRAAVTPLAPPTVTISSIAPGANHLTVNATIVDDGGTPVNAYEYRLDGGAWTSVSTSTNSFTIGELTTGQSYQVEIRGVTSAGVGPASPAVSAVPHTTPDAPTGLAATRGAGQVSLTWTAPVSDGGQPVTDYVVQYGTNPAGPFTTFADGTSAATSATVTGLTNGTAYVFRVAAVNTAGTGSYSTLASATPLGGPSAPSITTITPGSRYLQVAFTAPASNGGSSITGYEYQLDGGTWRASSGTSSPLTITGLTNGHAYTVAIRAVNAVGAGAASGTRTATPYGLPGAVIGLLAAPGANSVELSWDPVDDNGSPVSAYNLIRWSAASEGSILGSYQTTATGYTVTGLGAGTHYFTIEATNAAGTGPRSAPRTSATIGATVPAAPAIGSLVIDGTGAVMSWTNGAPGTSAINGHVVQHSTDGTTWSTVSFGSSASSASFDVPSTATPYVLRVASISAAGVGAYTTVRPPMAATPVATDVDQTSATVDASVNANDGGAVSVSFELATSPAALGTPAAMIVSATPATVGGSSATTSTAALAALDPGTTYHVRAVVAAGGVVARGPVESFTTRASVTSSGLTAVYDGTPVTLGVATAPAGLSVTRTFEGINGTTYPLSVTAPTNAGTYRVTSTIVDAVHSGEEVATLTIHPRVVTIAVAAEDKAYDGSTDAQLTLGLHGAVDGDDVRVDGSQITGSFVDADAGVNKVVTITAGANLLIGSDAGNYSAMIAAATLATIDPAEQTLTFASDAPDPGYVGDTYAPAVVSDAGLTPTLTIDAAAEDVCELSDDEVVLLASGTCVVLADQGGTANVTAAATAEQRFEVEPVPAPTTTTTPSPTTTAPPTDAAPLPTLLPDRTGPDLAPSPNAGPEPGAGATTTDDWLTGLPTAGSRTAATAPDGEAAGETAANEPVAETAANEAAGDGRDSSSGAPRGSSFGGDAGTDELEAAVAAAGEEALMAGAARVADRNGSSTSANLRMVAVAVAAALTAGSGLWLVAGKRRSREEAVPEPKG